MCQNFGFCVLAIIRMIATSNPKQEQTKPPRDPAKSSAKKHASAPADRAMILNASGSFD
jgi:hypothetical protein